jgi:RimJ/RimL family protein N-acetyltransferase
VPFDPTTIKLVEGQGSTARGGGRGCQYWHIFVGEVRAGNIYINLIDEVPFGQHASIQIHVNQTHRGRGVGKVAYRLACEQSEYETVVAHMRKSNFRSQRAAAAAGFVVVEHSAIKQLAMRWTKTVTLMDPNLS